MSIETEISADARGGPNPASILASYIDGSASDFYTFIAELFRVGESDGFVLDAVEADETGVHFVLADGESGGALRRVTLVRAGDESRSVQVRSDR